MPRDLRPLVDGGLYHVCCGTARRDDAFDRPDEARLFIDLLRELKERDGCTVAAWSVVPGRYQMALKTSSVRLSRTMHALQGRFAQGYNRRHGTVGSFWHGRFKACLVNEQRHLDDLVVYVHLDPVRAEIVEDPADYPFCGHHELLGHVEHPIIDVENALAQFDSSPEEARMAYLGQIRAAHREEWLGLDPTGTPWWRTRRDLEQLTEAGQAVGGRPVALSTDAFLELACRALETDVETLASRFKAPEIVHHRELVATIGLERFHMRAKDIAHSLKKHPDWISHLASQGARRRMADPAYRKECDRIETAIIDAATGRRTTAYARKDESDWAVW